MVRQSASSLISHIAAIELPRNNWNNLVEILFSNFTNTDNSVRLACIQTTGYICEELIKIGNIIQILPTEIREKLVSVLAGSLDNHDTEIIVISLKAIFNAYDFLKETLQNDDKRNFIINNIVSFCKSDNIEVSQQALMLLIHFVCYN
mmetsp:Transcript_42775/g.35941  ORF Transcript_42775/g.35941 Transcript_42775/m.35941 type:complete len:148 (-) Transcript_42775:36-479(-)